MNSLPALPLFGRLQMRQPIRWLRWFGMLLVLLVTLLAPRRAMAQQAPQIKVKETVVLDEVGDARFTLDIKMPVGPYTALKARTPNTALLLRKIGLSHHEYYEVTDMKGDFDDGSSTVRIKWTTRGMARPGRDRVWEAPVDENSGLEVLSIHDNVAIFSTAMSTQLGVATLVVQAEVPRGSSELRLVRSPNRLAFRMPTTARSLGSHTSLDLEFQAKPQLMSCLAKSYGNPKFSKMWAARTLLKNAGDQEASAFRVRFRLKEYAPTWSAWKSCPTIVPGQTVVDPYFPVFDFEKLGKLNGSVRDTLELEYEYHRVDGQLVEATDSRVVQLLGRNEVYFSSMPSEECVTWQDYFDYGPVILASFTTRDDPIMQQIAGWVSGQAGGVAAAGSDEDAVKFLYALYEFMAANSIAYQTPPGGEFNGKFGQHVKYGRDVLQNRAGTCIDLAILYGSVCEAVGLRPVLLLVSGHCFPGIYLPKSGRFFMVETTCVGKRSFQDAVEIGRKELEDWVKDGRYFIVDIEELHAKGVYGLQLPTLPASTLADWEIRKVRAGGGNVAKMDAPNPPRTDAPNAPAIPAWMVATWKCDTEINGVRIQMWAVLNADGAYKMALRTAKGKEAFKEWVREEGTFRVANRAFVFTPSTGKDAGVSFTRKYVVEGGYLWVTFDEIHYQLPFAKSK